jgi:non-ribosomal peptide synthetase component F
MASLAKLFELSATKRPQAFALEFASNIIDSTPDSVKLTYDELNTHANKLAHHLISLNVAPDELVCVCMEKSPTLYVSILAVLKAGAGFLPLTPETPKERVKQILENAGVKLCLTTTDIFRDSLEIPQNVYVVLADNVKLGGCMDTNPVMERSGKALAYAIFTSGSTGVPKGVLIANENIVDNLLALKEVYPTDGGSKLLQFSTISFDGLSMFAYNWDSILIFTSLSV